MEDFSGVMESLWRNAMEKPGGRGVSKSIWIPRSMISLGDIGLGGFEWGG